MKRTNKNVSYSDALKVAGKKWKSQKRGGAATGVADNAATVGGDNYEKDAVIKHSADELDADADMVRASASGGKRRKRRRTKRRGGKCGIGGKRRKSTKRRRRRWAKKDIEIKQKKWK